MNFGFEEERDATFFKAAEFRPSLMATYPLNYKFTSVEIGASDTRKVYQRKTYDLLNAFGDIGGINEAIRICLQFFVVGISLTVEQSLIAKYLYRQSRDNNGQVSVPKYLEAKYIFNRIFFCCKIDKFAKYLHSLERVEEEVNMNLDLIQFIRRMRMHGAAITILLKAVERGYLTVFSKKKSIDDI